MLETVREYPVSFGLKSKPALLKMLQEIGCAFSGFAPEVIEQIDLPQRRERLNLVLVYQADLSLPEWATREAIYTRAQERGWDLCPAWVGLALRLAYKDQPKGERLHIGMEPIDSVAPNGVPMKNILSLFRGDITPWIGNDNVTSVGAIFRSHRVDRNCWAFVQPTKIKKVSNKS